ncbi:hypothetical protein [Bdellovibrio bacteriovorus]|uniref:hypothetical protein n=1 Tax=Bdellovibrio bacteriovorus TaxID=959 RepID=UPI0035A585B3
MDPVTTTVAVMTGVTQAINITKTLKELDLKLNEAEGKLKLADLYIALSDVKMNVADLKAAILDKDDEIKQLKEQLQLQDEMQYNGVFYFRALGEKKDGPFCAQCFDSEKKLIRLHNYMSGWWECKTCDSRYEEDVNSGAQRRANTRVAIDYDPLDY